MILQTPSNSRSLIPDLFSGIFPAFSAPASPDRAKSAAYLEEARAILRCDRQAVLDAFTAAFDGEPLRFQAVLKESKAARLRARALIQQAIQEARK